MRSNQLEKEISLGEQLFQNGKVLEALKVFEDVLEKNPANCAALNNRAVALENLGNRQEAISIFLEILRKDNHNTDALFNLIAIYETLENWDAIRMILAEYGDVIPSKERELICGSIEGFDNKGQYSSIKKVNLSGNLENTSLDLTLFLNLQELSQQIMWSYFSKNQLYEEETSLFLAKILEKGDFVIDIGGHIGYFSLLASQFVGDEGQVFTFEPSRSNCNHLNEHIRINKRTNILPYNLALGSEVKESEFFINLDNDGGHALWDVGLHGFNEKSRRNKLVKRIKVETIDNIFREKNLHACKLIKIDTEGAEFDILRGSTRTLSRHEIPYVVCEINRFGLKQMGTSEGELRQLMSDLGYDAYLFTGDSEKTVKLPPNHYLKSNVVFNVLFRKGN